VQVSRVDLDGRKIDFRLVREGEELTARALKDKGVAGSPSGVPAKASTKRAARKAAPAAERSAKVTAPKVVPRKATTKPKGGRKSRR